MKRIILSIFLLVFSQQLAAWWDINWTYRVPLDISNNSGQNLTDYSYSLTISAATLPNFDWSNNGEDLRLVDNDDSTSLSYFLEDFDAVAQTATLWIRIPATINNASSHSTFIYYGNSAATSTSSSSAFSELGIKYHSRRSTGNPSDRAGAETIFNGLGDGVTGYGCSIQSHVSPISNQSIHGANRNYGLLTETFFEVTTAGQWDFRFGGDFGQGGEIYVDGQTVDADWTNNLWWAGNWGHVDVLQGSINLGVGAHSLRVLGFENCCDGSSRLQYSTNAGLSWNDVSSSNLTLRAAQCPVDNLLFSFGTEEKAVDIEVTKDDASLNYTPGTSSNYQIVVTNHGPGDITNLTLTDDLNNGLLLAGTVTCLTSSGSSCSVTVAVDNKSFSVSIDLIKDEIATLTVPVSYSADPSDY